MMQLATWLKSWSKRLLHRPLLLFTILLMPLTALFLQHCQTKQDAVLRVALWSEGASHAEYLEEITSLSDPSIRFYICPSREKLLQDVKEKQANCGYVFPAGLEEKIASYIQDQKPFLTVVRGKDDFTTRIVDEILLSKNYRAIAYRILEEFLAQKISAPLDREQLARDFEAYCSNELLFQFQYLSGEENKILQGKRTGLLLLPLRGLTGVILCLACMAGGLMCYEDRRRGLYQQMTGLQKSLSWSLSLLLPGAAACLSALLSLKIAGVSDSLSREIPAILCYLFACAGLATLLGHIFPRQGLYLAAMPVLLLLSLTFPPVFINLESFLPGAGKLSGLLPVTWYLNSIQTPGALLILLLYGAVCLLLSQGVRLIRNLH